MRGLRHRPSAGLRQALDENPCDADALALLAESLEASGDTSRALDTYREALAAHPAFPGDLERLRAAIERLRQPQ
ncbi:MAG: tetratricopeptide repeat protein [Planctomycetota bacterium]